MSDEIFDESYTFLSKLESTKNAIMNTILQTHKRQMANREFH